MDQDVPAPLSNMNPRTSEVVKLFVPSRSFQPSVSLGYSNWWKSWMSARESKIMDVKNANQVPSSVQRNGNNQDRHATVADINRLDPSQASTDPDLKHSKSPGQLQCLPSM